MMTSSSSSKSSEDGEPSSYRHMEEALSGNPAPVALSAAGVSAMGIASDASKSDCSMDTASAQSDNQKIPVATTPSTQSTSLAIQSKHEVAIPVAQSLEAKSDEITESFPPPQNARVTSSSDLREGIASTAVKTAVGASHAHGVNTRHDAGPPRVIHASTLPTETGYAVAEPLEGAAVASSAVATVANIPVPIQPISSPSDHQIAPASTSERSTKPKGGALRRGKWTAEEEAYVARVIQDFNSGFLNAPAGTTLRSYLSDKLQCDPMRITKKFTGESCIGKRVFHPAVRSPANTAAIDKAQAELDALEKRWRRRLEIQQRESAKKAAAAAAVAGSGNRVSSAMVQGVPVSLLGASAHGAIDSQLQQTAVTQAASWLDRANAILRGTTSSGTNLNSSAHSSAGSSPGPKDESTQSSGDDSLENQMKEVRRLIYEGPVIQQTAADLPSLLLQPSTSSEQLGGTATGAMAVAQSTAAAFAGPISPDMEPADKRMRTSPGSATSGAEDAEALIGFLSSVRASAAASQDL